MTCALHAWQWDLATGRVPDLGRARRCTPAGRRAEDDGSQPPGGTTGGAEPDAATLAAATSDVETAAMIASVERRRLARRPCLASVAGARPAVRRPRTTGRHP